jgi:hypothetical protein
MKFKIERASNKELNLPNAVLEKDEYGRSVYTVEVNTLEELLALCDETDSGIVIHHRGRWEGLSKIIIYDGYLE